MQSKESVLSVASLCFSLRGPLQQPPSIPASSSSSTSATQPHRPLLLFIVLILQLLHIRLLCHRTTTQALLWTRALPLNTRWAGRLTALCFDSNLESEICEFKAFIQMVQTAYTSFSKRSPLLLLTGYANRIFFTLSGLSFCCSHRIVENVTHCVSFTAVLCWLTDSSRLVFLNFSVLSVV